MKRNQWSAVVLAVLLFCSGVAVGALAHRYYSATVVNAKGSEDFRQRYLSEMRSKLGLTSAQVDQLETIMDETKARTRAVRDQYRPEMLKIRSEQISRVKSILTPQQLPIYEQLVAEHERHAREQEEHDRKEEQKRAANRHPMTQ
ncbi:MAG: hypothetical protein JO182_24060 [Acidobacteriaceae bacterium]|nr:hypothetical protein [Acidobacteriaceae bacterium]MBV9037587.1 hypothetical protein [Acidobacteriaceae bacterium]MBV9223597.1 hypothetical protein [Acidobacteriaceae bacterium]MBV9306784.1 hypothetical protein [Acidobacteriaceae bacterium]MBV9938596.1 hypothetical protein [Acidobacteriaceae bacterium]